jgi:mannose-1-phosphate guanylyltransferase
MTLGISPTFPNTGYGYIEFDKDAQEDIKVVNQFREKPDYETAKDFISQGNFLWNAGIFMWSAKSVTAAFKKFQPKLYEVFENGISSYNTALENEFIKNNYAKAENISVDYAIMEAAKNVFVAKANFDWNDLGTWGSLYDKLDTDINDNAIVNAKVLAEEASGNMIRTDKEKLVVVDGLNDYIIIDKEEVLMIYPKSKEQDIKKIVNRVNKDFNTDLT